MRFQVRLLPQRYMIGLYRSFSQYIFFELHMLPRSNQKGEQNRQTAVLFIDIEVTTDEEHLFTT